MAWRYPHAKEHGSSDNLQLMNRQISCPQCQDLKAFLHTLIALRFRLQGRNGPVAQWVMIIATSVDTVFVGL